MNSNTKHIQGDSSQLPSFAAELLFILGLSNFVHIIFYGK